VIELSLMHGWTAILGSLAMIALILTACGIMLSFVKPADAAKHVGAVLGIVIVLALGPGIFVGAWSAILLWQKIALLAIAFVIWQWRRPRRQQRKNGRE